MPVAWQNRGSRTAPTLPLLSEGFQDSADWAGERTSLGFPGGWVGVGSYLVHPLHPELAHQDLQGGHEWDGEEDPDEAEERAHHEEREDNQGGVEINGPAHDDRLQ